MKPRSHGGSGSTKASRPLPLNNSYNVPDRQLWVQFSPLPNLEQSENLYYIRLVIIIFAHLRYVDVWSSFASASNVKTELNTRINVPTSIQQVIFSPDPMDWAFSSGYREVRMLPNRFRNQDRLLSAATQLFRLCFRIFGLWPTSFAGIHAGGGSYGGRYTVIMSWSSNDSKAIFPA